MSDLAQILTLPFMQRALLGGVLVAILASLVGILVVLRRASFFGDSVAHASLAGVALGLLLGLNPLLTAAGFAVLIAFLLPILQQKSRLPLDSLLGFILPFSMGLGMMILSRLPGYQPELVSFLFGSILAIGWEGLGLIVILSLVTLGTILILKEQLIFASFDQEYARITGLPVRALDIIYSILVALTIVASLRLVGIVLVNALLVVPAATARLYAKSLKQMFILTPILSVMSVLVGLFLAYLLNFPVGPTIAVVAGSALLVSIVISKI